MKTMAKRIWNITTWVIVGITVFFAIFMMGSRLLGFKVFNVLSGSMSPSYNKGDLIYVKPVDPDSVKVGDVITFVMNNKLDIATHRVVDIDNDKNCFYTKGDTNNTIDPEVHFNNLIGIPVFKIPLLGYVSDFIQNPPGVYITIGVVAILLIAVFAPDFIKKKKNKSNVSDTGSAESDIK